MLRGVDKGAQALGGAPAAGGKGELGSSTVTGQGEGVGGGPAELSAPGRPRGLRQARVLVRATSLPFLAWGVTGGPGAEHGVKGLAGTPGSRAPRPWPGLGVGGLAARTEPAPA